MWMLPRGHVREGEADDEEAGQCDHHVEHPGRTLHAVVPAANDG